MIQPITHFATILPNYDLFFIDIWGVVHDGIRPYPGTIDAINHLIDTKKVIFLSNAPRPAEVIMNKLQEYGINITVEGILTSGDVVRAMLCKDPTKTIYHIGEDKNQDILRNINVKVVNSVKDADLILLSAFLDDPEKDDKFDEDLQEAAALKLPLICANPDTYVPNGSNVRRCAGIFAARYKQMDGKVIYCGKPHPNIFKAAIEKFLVTKNKILMIGDTFETDVLGARNAGIDVAMTLTGNGTKSYDKLASLGSEYGVSPTWVIEGLWLK